MSTFLQLLYDSVSKCICSLGESSYSAPGESLASRPKGASYAEFSPPKLRTTDLSTQLSSTLEDNHIFASATRTPSRYATPPSSRTTTAVAMTLTSEPPHFSSFTPAPGRRRILVGGHADDPDHDGDDQDHDHDHTMDRTSAEVLAKARIQAMKGTAIRTRRTLTAADPRGTTTCTSVPNPKHTHSSFISSSSYYSNRPLNDKSHKRRMEIFRSRHVPGVEFVEPPKRAYHCGTSADEAFHLAASIFRVTQEDTPFTFPGHSSLPMLCFAKPLDGEEEENTRRRGSSSPSPSPHTPPPTEETTPAALVGLNPGPSRAHQEDLEEDEEEEEEEDASTASSFIYPPNSSSQTLDPSVVPTLLRPVPLYDHYLVLVSEDHKDEIARIMKAGSHKSFEWMMHSRPGVVGNDSSSSEYMMNTGSSEDKQDPLTTTMTTTTTTTATTTAPTKRLSHDDVHIFEGTSKFLALALTLDPVTEEKEKVGRRVESIFQP